MRLGGRTTKLTCRYEAQRNSDRVQHLVGRPLTHKCRASHPHVEVLERVADVDAAVLRTDEMGTIEVITDGEQMWWEAPD